jgi:protein-tyrosine phosphatase
MEQKSKIRVLFVCLGNICRSPMAEAVFRQLTVEAGLTGRFEIYSAATSNWEVGKPPHPGTREILRQHQIDLDPAKRAVQVNRADLEQADYLIAMDYENLVDLRRLSNGTAQIHRLMEFAGEGYPADIPDPYYTGDFMGVYDLIEAGCRGLLQTILGRPPANS